MSKGRELRCFDYVNHSYERVREALTGDTGKLFAAATRVAESRAESVASALRVNIAGIEVGKKIDIAIHTVEEHPSEVLSVPVTRLELEWKAAGSSRLFPLMKGELAVYPLTATETQLDFSGRYEPPLGPLGSAVDAIAGHRIAEASVHRFLGDVADHLRRALSADGDD